MFRQLTACFYLLICQAIGCSAPALPGDLRDAERHEARGELELAKKSYRAAQRSCQRIDNLTRRQLICRQAILGEVEIIARTELWQKAVQAYAQAHALLQHDPTGAAEAEYRWAKLLFDNGNVTDAYRHYWHIVTTYSAESFASDALGDVVRDGKLRAPVQLAQELVKLVEAMPDSRIADNLVFALAELNYLLGKTKEALQCYDMVADRYLRSGLRDDALWAGAKLAKEMGDFAGAVKRLRTLLSTREVAFGAGSYFSVHLDNAQLELGRILRDSLRDNSGALAAFTQLSKDYPHSTLRDDALWELAVTHQAAGDRTTACETLERLARDWPDSKYWLNLAPALQKTLLCPTSPE